MKRKFYSWEECMNLREVKVRVQILCTGYLSWTYIFLVKPLLCNFRNDAQSVGGFAFVSSHFPTHTSKNVQHWNVKMGNDCFTFDNKIVIFRSRWRSWTMRMWWNWRRSSERTITSTLSLSIWRRTCTSLWRTGKKRNTTLCQANVFTRFITQFDINYLHKGFPNVSI